MDLDSPSPPKLSDLDERFRLPSPPPPPLLSPPVSTSVHHLSNRSNSINDNTDLNLSLPSDTSTEPFKETDLSIDTNESDQTSISNSQDSSRSKETSLSKTLLTTKLESISPTEGTLVEACLSQLKQTSQVNNHHHSPSPNEETPTEDSNRSRDELVRLLAKKVYVPKSSSPAKVSREPEESSHSRRHSFDENDNDISTRRNRRSVHHKTQ